MEGSKKTVILITHYADLMGANRSLLSFAHYLSNHKNYNPLVVIPFNGNMATSLKDLEIPYLVSRFYTSTYVKTNFISSLKRFFKEYINIYLTIILFFKVRNKNVSLIHSNSSVINIGIYLALLLKKPHILHIREFAQEHYGFSYNWGLKYQFFLFKKTNVAIAISKAVYEKHIALFKDKIHVVYNGISMPNFDIKKEPKRSFREIALVGLIHPSKHQNIVLDALNLLVNKMEITNFRLHIYGGDEIAKEYSHYLKQLVIEYGLSNFVIFHGYVNKIPERISGFDIGILASEFEAFGRVTVEYMKLGLVPIVSNSGANAEIVEDGISGLVFDLNDVNGLAILLSKLLRDNDLLIKISLEAKKRADFFSEEKYCLNIIKLYEKFI